MKLAALLTQDLRYDEKVGPNAPKVSRTKGMNWLLIWAALAPYFLIFVASLCLAKCNGAHISETSGLGSEMMGWVIVTSANIGVESPDVTVRTILPLPVRSRSLKGPNKDSGTS